MNVRARRERSEEKEQDEFLSPIIEVGGRKGIMGRTLTWNHSPLGRAGLIQEAKKMAVITRMG